MLFALAVLAVAVCVKGLKFDEEPSASKTTNPENAQFGPLMQAHVPLGERLPGFPLLFPGVNRGDPRFYVFPEDSAATHEDSVRRCAALGGRLADLSADVVEVLGCLVNTPAFVGNWQGEKALKCRLIMPGGMVVEAEDLCGEDIKRSSICQIAE